MNNEPEKKVRFDEDATLNVEAAVEHIERQLSPDELRNILDLKQPGSVRGFFGKQHNRRWRHRSGICRA